jgi:hypothetical protein
MAKRIITHYSLYLSCGKTLRTTRAAPTPQLHRCRQHALLDWRRRPADDAAMVAAFVCVVLRLVLRAAVPLYLQ